MERHTSHGNGEDSMPMRAGFTPERMGGPEPFEGEHRQELIYPFDIEYGDIESVTGFEKQSDGARLRESIHGYFVENDVSFQSAVVAVRALIGTEENRENPGEVQKLNDVINAVHQEYRDPNARSGDSQKLPELQGNYLVQYVQAARSGISQLEYYAQFVREVGDVSYQAVEERFRQLEASIEDNPKYDWEYWQEYFLRRAHTGSDPSELPSNILKFYDDEEQICLPKRHRGAILDGLDIAKQIKHKDMDEHERFVLEPSPEVGHIIRQVNRLPSAEQAIAVLDSITDPLFDRITEVKEGLEATSGMRRLGRQMSFRDNFFPLHVAETAFETVTFKRHLEQTSALGASLEEGVESYLHGKSWHLDLEVAEEQEDHSGLNEASSVFIDVLSNVVEPLGPEARAQAESLFDALLEKNVEKLRKAIDKTPQEIYEWVHFGVTEAGTSGEGKFGRTINKIAGKASEVDTLLSIKRLVTEQGMSLGEAKAAILEEFESSDESLESVITNWADGWNKEVSRLHQGRNKNRRLPVSADDLPIDGSVYGLLQGIYFWNDRQGATRLAQEAKEKATALVGSKMQEARNENDRRQHLIDFLDKIESRGEAGPEERAVLGRLSYAGKPLLSPESASAPTGAAQVDISRDISRISEFKQGWIRHVYGDSSIELISISKTVDQILPYLEEASTVQHAVHAFIADAYGRVLGEPEIPMDIESLASGLADSFAQVQSVLKSYKGGASSTGETALLSSLMDTSDFQLDPENVQLVAVVPGLGEIPLNPEYEPYQEEALGNDYSLGEDTEPDAEPELMEIHGKKVIRPSSNPDTAIKVARKLVRDLNNNSSMDRVARRLARDLNMDLDIKNMAPEELAEARLDEGGSLLDSLFVKIYDESMSRRKFKKVTKSAEVRLPRTRPSEVASQD